MAKEAIDGKRVVSEEHDDDDEEEGEGEEVEGWEDWRSEKEDSSPDFLCFFCSSRFDSLDTLFAHCRSDHSFDFHGVVKEFQLNFYGSLKLVNYIRSQVAENKCWRCGQTHRSGEDLQRHLHGGSSSREMDEKVPWEDDLYLKPYMVDDAVLHNLDVGDDDEICGLLMDKEEMMGQFTSNGDLAELCNNIENGCVIVDSELNPQQIDQKTDQFDKPMCNGIVVDEHQNYNNKQLRAARASIVAREIKNVDDNYFGAYGSFGIHREMLSDKVRMDAYRSALLANPTLLKQATVLDVGCGTGILSLFAAKAGASRVVAVDASSKMASVATQIAKDNGLLAGDDTENDEQQDSRVINVVHSMIEGLDKQIKVEPNSVDVLVSEWMGYCLLYESMLSSVIYARDHFLKPGGAVLPDTATIFGAGFGRCGTSLPFWENVYSFDMSCVGKEVVNDAARFPIVDTVDAQDIVTESAVLHTLDLVTMKRDEMDFTSSFELKLKPGSTTDNGVTWCYGIVLWFETGFTSRFCKECPAVLSTSPYSPKTHWSQTIFTFREPIAMCNDEFTVDTSTAVGSTSSPVTRIRSRISIARSSAHRSIDVSVETTGISSDGRKCSWPVQIFNL